jgi:hypothetical protein
MSMNPRHVSYPAKANDEHEIACRFCRRHVRGGKWLRIAKNRIVRRTRRKTRQTLKKEWVCSRS